MKKSPQTPRKLTLKKISIVHLTPEAATKILGGYETQKTKPPPTESCKTCGSAVKDCTGQ